MSSTTLKPGVCSVSLSTVIVSLENLDEEALIRILKEPKNAIYKQYQKLLKMDGIELSFDDDALNEIAKMAIERETGARGLRSIIESIMMKPMFELPSIEGVTKVTVTRDVIKGTGELVIEKGEAEDNTATTEQVAEKTV